jgi:hypothetical protein
MSCGNHCYEIGGPWISEDPNCPVHGHEAQRAEKAREEADAAKDARITELEQRVEAVELALEALKGAKR